MSIFSVIATPIGNLEDITLRALRVLKEANLIICEDTRTTGILLKQYDIHKPTLSYHAHSKLSRVDQIIELLKEGKNIALVSDAGTPGISDPGALLVSRLRDELKEEIKANKIKIETIPGPAAFVAALSIAGVPCADFTFLGFIPHKKGRETLFREILASERTMVFYESPHRIMKTLNSLAVEKEGSFKKKITICRELTKVYEEVVSASASEIRTYFEINPSKLKGELVVIVSNTK